jgi:hypothetical protein
MYIIFFVVARELNESIRADSLAWFLNEPSRTISLSERLSGVKLTRYPALLMVQHAGHGHERHSDDLHIYSFNIQLLK